MRKTRIVFVGTRTWRLTNQHLEYFTKNDANIVAYVESPTENIVTTTAVSGDYKPIHEVAAEQNTPIYCPKSPKDPEFIEIIREINPDVIVVCGYQFYIPETVLELPRMGVVNFHTSLLPRHCGRHPGFQTIFYGDKESGMALHFMDAGLDTGDLIYENRVPVLDGDTVDSLYERIWDNCEPLVKRLLDDLDSDSLPRIPQDPDLYFYNYELDERDFELDFRQPAQLLKNRVEMMRGKFYFVHGDRRFYIQECSAIAEPSYTRNFKIRVPFLLDGKITLVTPRQFLRIDKVVEDGHVVDPLTVLDTSGLKVAKSPA